MWREKKTQWSKTPKEPFSKHYILINKRRGNNIANFDKTKVKHKPTTQQKQQKNDNTKINNSAKVE